MLETIIFGLTVIVLLWTIWIVRARRALRRIAARGRIDPAPGARGNATASFSMEPFPASPDLEFARLPTPPFNTGNLSVQRFAILDGMALAFTEYRSLQEIVLLAESLFERVGEESLALANDVEGVGQLALEPAAILAAALPAEVMSWAQDSLALPLAELLQGKSQILDSGGSAELPIDLGEPGLDFNGQFPYVTLVVSSCKELTRLGKGDTTLGRALTHVVMDVAAVTAGTTAGSVMGAVVGGALMALDIGFTGGAVSALAALCGIGGGVAGAKASARGKLIPLENLCRGYTQKAAAAAAAAREATGRARKALEELQTEFEARRLATLRERAEAWAEENERTELERTRHLQAFIEAAPAEILRMVEGCRGRLALLDLRYRRRRWLLWWPSGANVSLWAERRLLQSALPALERAGARLAVSNEQNVEARWQILLEAAREDSMGWVESLLQSFLKRCSDLREAYSEMQDRHQSVARQAFETLSHELQKRRDQILQNVRRSLEPLMTSLRVLEGEVLREARAVGASFK